MDALINKAGENELGYKIETQEVYLTNSTGGAVAAGDVLPVSIATDGSFSSVVTGSTTLDKTGVFVVAAEAVASTSVGKFYLRGVVTAKTKNGAQAGGSAIARGQMYGPDSTNVALDSNILTAGPPPFVMAVDQRFLAFAVDTGTVGATNTAAQRLVVFDGVNGFNRVSGVA